MNNNNENVIVSESRIAYGGVGIAIMMISLMEVIKFIPETSHDPLLEIVMFLCTNGLLWLVFALVMSVTRLGFFLFDGKNKAIPPKSPIMSASSKTPASASATSQVADETTNHEDYQQRNEAVAAEKEERENRIIAAIDKYIRYVMAPYLEESQLNQLLAEVMGWSEDSHYTPLEVRLKERLNATDLMHFVWNVGERLSMIADGYSGNVRAIFAKSLFPSVMKAEVETIRRNLTTTQGRFTIAIDKPDSGSYEFHCPGE